MRYIADGWVILKVTCTKTSRQYYKVFSSPQKENTRANACDISGNAIDLPELSTCGKCWIWEQKLIACYELPIESKGKLTPSAEDLLASITSGNNIEGITIEQITLADLLKEASQDK